MSRDDQGAHDDCLFTLDFCRGVGFHPLVFFPGERAAMIMQTMCRETARLEPRISRTPLGFIQTLAWWRRLAAMRTKHTTKA